jgi:D-alanyl-D-alanine carboxypeptidase
VRKTWFFLLVILCVSLLGLICVWFFYPQKTEQRYAVTLFPLENVPVLKSHALTYEDLALSATAVYALDLSSNTVLYEKNSQTSLYPASTSKMMTALVAVDSFALNQTLQAHNEATVSGNKLGIKEGQLLTVRDLLASMLIFSANDSAYVLANNDQLGFNNFIQKMNNKALELGLSQTHFANPAGLDEEEQKTTARDLTIIAKELLRNKQLRELVATPHQRIEGSDWSYDLYNSNQLIGQIQGVMGVKTGTTDLAGEVLVAFLEKDGHQILLTLMGSQDRYQDASKLITWIFNNYEWKTL